MVQQAIQRAIESWVEVGRERDAIKDGHTFVLRYGPRFKLTQVALLSIFALFLCLGIVLVVQGDRTAKALLCLSFFALLTAFSSIYVTYAFTARVIINDTCVVVRCFGMTISNCSADSLSTAYKSPSHPSVVLRNLDGKKTRISTQFDGLRSLVAWLRMRQQNALTDSILAWMESEAPDL